jgi:hypothetical protein
MWHQMGCSTRPHGSRLSLEVGFASASAASACVIPDPTSNEPMHGLALPLVRACRHAGRLSLQRGVLLEGLLHVARHPRRGTRPSEAEGHPQLAKPDIVRRATRSTWTDGTMQLVDALQRAADRGDIARRAYEALRNGDLVLDPLQDARYYTGPNLVWSPNDFGGDHIYDGPLPAPPGATAKIPRGGHF